MYRWLLPLFAGLASAGCSESSPSPVILRAVGPPQSCHAELRGCRLTNAQLLRVARAWRGRPALVVAAGDAPYKCVGGIVYTLQQAGVRKVTFAFISEPPPEK